GAQVNGQYVLNYTNELSKKIKTLCKREANDILEEMRAELRSRIEEERSPLLEQKDKLDSLRESSIKQMDLETGLANKLEFISDVLTNEVKDESEIKLLNTKLNDRYQFIKEDVYEIEQQTEADKKVEAEEVTINKDTNSTRKS